MRAKCRSRRMFFETLESRQMLTVVPIEGTPFWDFPGNYLPPQSYQSSSNAGFLSGPAAGDPLTVALNYLQQNAAGYGLTPNDLTDFNITSQYASPDLGVTHIYLEQTYNELPVANANININVMTDGRILTAGSNFIRGISQLEQEIAPNMSPEDAVFRFADALGISPDNVQIVSPPSGLNQHTVISAPSVSFDPIDVELHYVPSPGGGVELAWEIIARPPGMTNWFDVSIAASGFREGSVIRVADWVANASYNVFPTSVQDPVFGSRSIVVDPWSPTASPFGWHDGNGTLAPDFTDTRGNNVFAQEDRLGVGFFQLGLPGGFRPQGGPALNFNFPIDFQQNPQTYESAAITNLFYWNNIAHDVSFNHGFTEDAGNFQLFNYTGTGLANDPVMAYNQEAFDLGLRNNAFMGTPPDGLRPTMGMFLFDSTFSGANLIPLRDGSLDGTIIAHEYTHGISNRLTGGPANANALQALQSGGMGEGWSDWFALVLTAKANHTKNTPRGTGLWVNGEDRFGEGIRRFPYSFDMSINPHTLNSFNGDNFPQQNNSEVHNAGEIWCQVLWDLTWILIEKYGFSSNLNHHTGGQNVAMDLVLGGMKLQPVNPSFIEARDAIIAADQALTGGQNFVELWTAFARRGFGASASSGPNSNSVEVSATFDLPPLPVGGTVFEDNDGDGVHDANEGPLAGWTVFNDANNNRFLDPGEPRVVTGADGTYSIPVPAGTTAHIREIVMPGWRLTAPSSGVFNINVALGQSLTNFNFLNQNLSTGGIRGAKFNDLDGNGTRDPGEPGIQGVFIYVDLNKDGRIGILEPSARTDANGNYFISNVRVGNDYHVREVVRPGLVQTFPDPTDPATLGGAHIDVDVVSGVTTTGINFGNQIVLDFGDAPATYGTLLANNGPRHGMLAGFGLTLTPGTATGVIDAEPNGLPHPSALGDDSTGVDDENGVLFPAGLVPGSIGEVVVGARTTGFSPAFLHAWVDFNRNGVFDASEKLVFIQVDGQTTNTPEPQLGHGVHTLRFRVPAGASLGSTFARFRFALERGLGPLGAASAGEVEDHSTNLLQDQAIAVNDFFPDRTRVPPDEFIKLNSDFTDPGNSLDVLRNDFGTSTDPTPEIVAANFTGPGQTLTTTAGGTVKFISPTAPLQYKPALGHTGLDSFQYQVTAGGSTSPFATVTINVSPSDPIAVDDIIRIDPGAGTLELPPPPLGVRDNDLAAANQPIFIVGQPTPLSATIPTGLTLTTNATNTNLVLTRQAGSAAATFQGTVRFTYTIDDVGDPSTAPSSAIVTIQITPSDTTPAASHLAIFKTQYLDANLNPTSIIDLDLSDIFWVELLVTDPPGGTPETVGVDAAYVDMIIKEIQKDNPLLPLVVPVLNAAQTNFVIQFEPAYSALQRTDASFSVPSTLQEIGATRGSPNPTGNAPDVKVMRVQFRALGGGIVRVQADHADSIGLPIALAIPFVPPELPPNPLAISDDQVFIQPAGNLTILPAGSPEGEFTNHRNQFDVNADDVVNQLDILLLINDLTQNGPRPLNQFLIALDGILPAGYLDVNIDAHVNIMDILNIVNHLTANSASAQSGSGGSGEGEGEGAGVSPGAAFAARSSIAPAPAEPDVGDPLGVMVNLLAGEQAQDEPAQDEPAQAGGADSDESLTSPSTAPIEVALSDSAGAFADTAIDTSESEAVDTAAADELFADLAVIGNQLKRIRLAR